VESEAIETLRIAIADAEPLGDVPELAATLAELSRVLMLTEQHAEAVAVADRALEVAARHDLVQPTVEALINRGTSLAHVGRRYEAEAVLRGVIVLADRHGQVAASLRALNNLASVRFTDDVQELTALCREGLGLAKRYGHRPMAYQFTFERANLAFRAGDWQDVLPEIDAIEEAESPYPFYAAGFAAMRALVAAARGNQEEAQRQTARLRELAEQLQSPMVDAFTHLNDGERGMLRGEWPVAFREGVPALANTNTLPDAAALLAHAAVAGNLPDAADAAAEALGQWATVEDLVDRWSMAAARAGLAARAGRWDEARAGYRSAIAGIREHGHLVDWALTCLDWGALGADREPEAADALTAGMAFFAERGAEAVARTYVDAVIPIASTAQPATPAVKAGSEATQPR